MPLSPARSSRSIEPPIEMLVPGMTTGVRGSQGSVVRMLSPISSARESPPNGISAKLRCPMRGASLAESAVRASPAASSHFRRQMTGGGTGTVDSQRAATVAAAAAMAFFNACSFCAAAANPPGFSSSVRIAACRIS